MPELPALTRVVTRDLVLTRVSGEDLPELHRLHADPRVWEHFPSGRHTSLAQSRVRVEDYIGDWEDGLGYWTARGRRMGEFVGIGGCRLRAAVAWNLYYRLDPASQGRGLAIQLARAALSAAGRVRPDLPVTAFLLEHNVASRAVAERIGLRLRWRGADEGNPDPAAVRLVYADRALTPSQLEVLRG